MAPSKHKEEEQISKSPAEFFAENQAIAGFDNMGKSLYTTLRELIENSLDACESVGVLPTISVDIEEMTQSQFNQVRGLSSPSKGGQHKDEGLFQKKKGKAASSSTKPGETTTDGKDGKPRKKRDAEGYFKISVRDNGCGMSHNAIPNLLGRVLSGSKYGVRQTRGKFGLGAKMALIWSKKSTGVPIKITTAHMKKPGTIGSHISNCVLDIDIYKNAPKIIEHTKKINNEKWVGTMFEVLIAGNWTTYKARIVQYLQQLAIITPYAQLELTYQNQSDSKKDMNLRYDRRSDQMPPPAKEVKHHPSSVNNLLVQQLIQRTKQTSLTGFLCKDLSAVSPSIAQRLIAELGKGYDEDMEPSELTDKQITRMVQLLRSVELFKAPDGSCLSPLGEYNLNLGIRKVLEPDVIATARDKASAYEGHPFIVEAAVSLGGKGVKEGITVVRFANRIPLLFEAGADVATRVAQSKIKWSSYKIDHKRDRIGVFVSIVSTKVPFKGTGKEYIGDDITEIQTSVKRALQSCCQQLRAHLTKRNALKDIKERKNRLVKYVPDICRSLYGLLDAMRKRKREPEDDVLPPQMRRIASSPSKRMRLDTKEQEKLIDKLNNGDITEATIQKNLMLTIEKQGATEEAANGNFASGKRKSEKQLRPVYLLPCYELTDPKDDLIHPLFVFRPMRPISIANQKKSYFSDESGSSSIELL